MRNNIYVIILCLVFSSYLNAQTDIIGNEQYNSLEECTYIDNLNQKSIPKLLSDLYHITLKPSDFKINSQEIDKKANKRNIYIVTKKARNGYLYVNENITNKLQKLDCSSQELTISYILNNQTISTKEQVNKLLKLKEKDILNLDISLDTTSHLLTINISTK